MPNGYRLVASVKRGKFLIDSLSVTCLSTRRADRNLAVLCGGVSYTFCTLFIRPNVSPSKTLLLPFTTAFIRVRKWQNVQYNSNNCLAIVQLQILIQFENLRRTWVEVAGAAM